MKNVEVWLSETSEPLSHKAISTYTKGPFYCVYCDNGQVVKYPVQHIFRVVEQYGTHAGDTLRQERANETG